MTPEQIADALEWGKFGWGGPPAPMVKASMPPGAVSATNLSSFARQVTDSFTSLGPGAPIAPPVPSEGQPRAWDYPTGYNVQQRPRAYEATSFALLRALSQNYDVARIAIETRIAEIRALDWAVIPKSVPGMNKADARARREGLQGQIDAAELFFLSPDKSLDFGTWIGEWLDDLLSIDAPTIYPRLSRNGDLHSLEIVDGATIRPIIDLYGRVPPPPDPAYGQVIKGMTWGLYTTDEIMYAPYRRRANSPYGYPPLEWVMLTVNRALRRQSLDLSMYSEGTMPVAFYKMPEGWTGTQLSELQELLDNILSGNDALRSRVRLMPGGGGTGLERVHPEPKNEVEEWLMTVTAAAFGTNPTELGFQPRGIGLGGKGFQEAQEAINYRKNLRPLGRHMKYQHDLIIAKHFSADLEWQWTGLIEEADQLKQAQTDEIYWRIGVYSSDFIARKQDVDPPGLGHIVAYNGNVIPVQAIIDQYGEFGDQMPNDAGDTDTDEPAQKPLSTRPTEMDGPNAPSAPDQPLTALPVAAPAQIAKASGTDDLAKWQRKSLRNMRMGKAASVKFDSNAIDPALARVISERLERARTVSDIREAFAEGGTGTEAPFASAGLGSSASFGPSTLRSSLARVRQFYSDSD